MATESSGSRVLSGSSTARRAEAPPPSEEERRGFTLPENAPVNNWRSDAGVLSAYPEGFLRVGLTAPGK